MFDQLIIYKELALEILKQDNKPLSVNEIWQKACEKNLHKKLFSIGQNPIATLRNIINADIREKHKNSLFIKATQKPTTFWLRARQNELINLNLSEEKEVRLEKTKFNERDLHPLLVKFLYENLDFRLNSKTIYHEKSKRSESGKDKWNYPDIVGVYFPYDDYQNETLGLLESLKLNNYKIFSFELKISINFSNLKELDSEVLSELRRLNQSFGIGVIQLDGSEISNSKIVLSAKEKALDMQTIDMLVDKNEDFKKFINDINQQIRAGKDAKIQAEFDRVKSDEEMAKYLKEKHILEG